MSLTTVFNESHYLKGLTTVFHESHFVMSFTISSNHDGVSTIMIRFILTMSEVLDKWAHK